MDNENVGARLAFLAFLRRHLMFLLTIALLCALSFVFYYSVRGHIPATMDVAEWRNISRVWVRHNDQRVSANRLAIVLALFLPQVSPVIS
jgi:hypothetical protein